MRCNTISKDIFKSTDFFAVAEKRVAGSDLPYFPNQPNTLLEVIEIANSYGDQIAIVSGEMRLSFSELYQLICTARNALKYDLKIQKGNIIALDMRNRPEWMVIFLAGISLGAIIAPINTWWTWSELEYGLELIDPSLIVTDRPEEYRSVSKSGKLSLSDLKMILESQDEKSCQQLPPTQIQADDIATIMFTSGATGKPKGVTSTHAAIISSLMCWSMHKSSSNDDTLNDPGACIISVPLFHVTGCHSLFLLSLMLGRKMVFLKRWDALEVVSLIKEECVTYFNGVPTMSADLVASGHFDSDQLPSLRHISSAGAMRPPAQLEKLRNKFSNTVFMSGYGTTETNALGTIAFGADYCTHPTSTGIPVPPITKIKIVDDTSGLCEPYELGEVCIASTSNSCGYWLDEEATQKKFKGPWFFTGDIGYLDKDGRLYIVDRKKDIIIRGGENISCLEVENALYQIEGVFEAAVFGVPDDRLGERVITALNSDYLGISEDMIVELLSKDLAKYKIPEEFWFYGKVLPKTGSGKINKSILRKEYESR